MDTNDYFVINKFDKKTMNERFWDVPEETWVERVLQVAQLVTEKQIYLEVENKTEYCVDNMKSLMFRLPNQEKCLWENSVELKDNLICVECFDENEEIIGRLEVKAEDLLRDDYLVFFQDLITTLNRENFIKYAKKVFNMDVSFGEGGITAKDLFWDSFGEKPSEDNHNVKLPFTVGDTVYVNGILGSGKAEEYHVFRADVRIKEQNTECYFSDGTTFYFEATLEKGKPINTIGFYGKDINKTVFATKKQALEALETEREGFEYE